MRRGDNRYHAEPCAACSRRAGKSRRRGRFRERLISSTPNRRGAWRLFFFQAEDGIRDVAVTGVQTCALPISFSPITCYAELIGPMFDNAYSSLLDDLHASGLLKNTLVLATGEFGRTPKINPAGGRDHWPQCWTIVLAGGAINAGQVVSSSDDIGSAPKDRPVTPSHVAATVYK